jgi:hypothetical protein
LNIQSSVESTVNLCDSKISTVYSHKSSKREKINNENNTINASNPPLSWTPQAFPQNPDAYLLYQRTISHAPKNILSRADYHWIQGSQQHRTYGPTYQTATPSAWATQTLGLNLVQGLAQHCHNSIEKIVHHCQTQRISYRKTQQQTKILTPLDPALPLLSNRHPLLPISHRQPGIPLRLVAITLSK